MKLLLPLLCMSQFISGEDLSTPINLNDPYSNELNIFHLDYIDHVVVAEGRGYFPVLNSLGSELFAIYRGGGGHLGRQGYLEFSNSFDGGKMWASQGSEDEEAGQPTVVVNSPHDDRNPAVCFTQSGRIICAYHEQASYTDDGDFDPSLNKAVCKIVYSDDIGLTWTNPKPLGVEGLESCSPYGKILELSDGTLLMNVYGPYSESVPKNQNVRMKAKDHSYIVRSDDDGETWHSPYLIASGHNETALFALNDQNLIAVSRDEYVGRLDLLRSNDQGKTWSRPIRITNPKQHPADIIQLSNGWLLLFYGDRSIENKVISGVVSKDNGQTWELQNRSVFSRPVRGDFGYPSAVRMPDGRIAVMYYWAGEAKNAYDGTQARLYVNFFNEQEWIDSYKAMFD